jgi:hypothetical protein
MAVDSAPNDLWPALRKALQKAAELQGDTDANPEATDALGARMRLDELFKGMGDAVPLVNEPSDGDDGDDGGTLRLGVALKHWDEPSALGRFRTLQMRQTLRELQVEAMALPSGMLGLDGLGRAAFREPDGTDVRDDLALPPLEAHHLLRLGPVESIPKPERWATFKEGSWALWREARRLTRQRKDKRRHGALRARHLAQRRQHNARRRQRGGR